MKDIKLDSTDIRILKRLQKDSSITNVQLAKEIGLSQAPTLERVKKFQKAGIIRGYHADLDPIKLGLGVSTFVSISLKGHNREKVEKFIRAVNKIDEVIECHHVTGAGDFILKIVCTDIAAYQKLIVEKLTEIDVVDGLQTMVILSTFKDSKSLPFGDTTHE